MTADDLLAALHLPAEAEVSRRVPKSLLLEHGAPTAADRRGINEGVDRLTWVATLKPEPWAWPLCRTWCASTSRSTSCG